MFIEFIMKSSYSIFIVEIKPDFLFKTLNNLFNKVDIVVLPLVPVTPTKSIL